MVPGPSTVTFSALTAKRSAQLPSFEGGVAAERDGVDGVVLLAVGAAQQLCRRRRCGGSRCS